MMKVARSNINFLELFCKTPKLPGISHIHREHTHVAEILNEEQLEEQVNFLVQNLIIECLVLSILYSLLSVFLNLRFAVPFEISPKM